MKIDPETEISKIIDALVAFLHFVRKFAFYSKYSKIKWGNTNTLTIL